MSLNNVSNDHRVGIALLDARPAFIRAEATPVLIRTLQHEAIDTKPASESQASRVFGGSSEPPDFKARAQALLNRLDALRGRVLAGGSEAPSGAVAAKVGDAPKAAPETAGHAGPSGWWSHGRWYSTAHAPGTIESARGAIRAPAQKVDAVTVPDRSGSTTTDSSRIAGPSAPDASQRIVPTVQSPTPTVLLGLSQSDSISLNDGATHISDAFIAGSTGIVGDNATSVSHLTLDNVIIRSENYGVYLGSADSVRLSNVDIETDANGSDSYSIRASVRSFESSDSVFRSGIKAFRLYGVESGSSTRDMYTGDRMMLGGGYANEWGPAAPFRNFTFRDGAINVRTVELYDNTSNVTFENMDFAGTSHISIQAGAHNITFKNCTNLPQIRLYGSGGSWTTLPADPARNIAVVNS